MAGALVWKGGTVTADRHEPGLMRHIEFCRPAVAGAGRLAFFLRDQPVGWVDPALVPALVGLGVEVGAGVAWLDAPARLPAIAQALAGQHLLGWRGEAFDVRALPGGAVLASIDRGALPGFGLLGEGVHMNGLVRRGDGLHVWVARRGADRPLDPGKLDHLVAGGIASGMTAGQTLVKEAAEEAGLPAELVAPAVAVGVIDYRMDRPEGLRRDRLHCYDLLLPEGFTPVAADGEAAGFELWPIGRVAETVAAGDAFKFNVNLVLIDLLLRHGVVAGPRLRAGLDAFRHGKMRVTRPSRPGMLAAIGPRAEE